MMNFLTQPQVPLDPRLTAAPMVAEQPTFTVGEYAKKKRIADALRGRVGKGVKEYDPLITTEANDYFPGQVQVNYAGILGNALNPWLEGKQEEKAAAAEEELQSEQDRILDGLDYSNLDPKKVMLLQRMGIDPTAVMKAAEVKEKNRPKLGTIPDIMFAVDQGEISPERGDEMIKQIQALKQMGVARTNISVNTGDTPLTPDQIYDAKMNEDVAAADAKRWSETKAKTYTALDSSEKAVPSIQVQRQFAFNDANWTGPQMATRALGNHGVPFMDFNDSPEYKQALQGAAENVREALAAHGGNDSNTDLKFVNAAQATGAATQPQAKAMVEYMEAINLTAREANAAAAAWMEDPANRKAGVVRPNFYKIAREKYAQKLDSSMTAYNMAPQAPKPKKKPLVGNGQINLNAGKGAP